MSFNESRGRIQAWNGEGVEPEMTLEREIWRQLKEVYDPEIPVLSVVDLGIVRRVEADEGKAVITITPTFSGCPALDVMLTEIHDVVDRLEVGNVEVLVTYEEPWSSDRISPEGIEKLRSFGLSPPSRHGGDIELVLDDPAPCPYCGSEETVRKNAFGSTLCRSIHYCRSCQQPFESFKPL